MILMTKKNNNQGNWPKIYRSKKNPEYMDSFITNYEERLMDQAFNIKSANVDLTAYPYSLEKEKKR